MSCAPNQALRLDLRSAAAADDRESQVRFCMAQLREALAAGHTTELVWPEDRRIPALAAILGASPAVLVCAAAANAPGSMVIHTRMGNVSEFLNIRPMSNISFLWHMNSDEAAMRWERHDAAPGVRLSGARRLAALGWNVQHCVGPMRPFRGWRDEYGQLAEELSATGVREALVTFPGEDPVEVDDPADGANLEPVCTASGVAIGVPTRHRREMQNFLRARIASAASGFARAA